MNEKELLKAKRERLFKLQLKEARKGYDTPPDILTEIDKIKEEIHELESQISWYYDDGSTTSNHIPEVVCTTIKQLKRSGIGGKVTICVLEITLEPSIINI